MKRVGRPKSTQTEVNIAAGAAAGAAHLVKNDRRIISRMTPESLTIPKAEVLRILKEDLGRRKFCLLHDNAPAHKAANVCQFLTQQNVTALFTPRTLQIYLRQTNFCSPSWK
jgi:hypothetical protein